MLYLNITFQQLIIEVPLYRRMPESKAEGGKCTCLNHTCTHPEDTSTLAGHVINLDLHAQWKKSHFFSRQICLNR